MANVLANLRQQAVSAHRRRTIRLRLTAMYGGVLLVSGVMLVTVGYLLARHIIQESDTLHRQLASLGHFGLIGSGSDSSTSHSATSFFDAAFNSAARAALIKEFHAAENHTLHQLAVDYIGILVVVFAGAVGAGWVMAGRALAPLRAITATARRVSGQNLGERISLEGPNDELRELAETFDNMLERLDAAFASQRHFVANASHELRTPLAIMRTEIDVALADPDLDVDELRAMAEALLETIDRSEALIASLLTLARSEAGPVRRETVDLAEIVESAVAGVESIAREREVSVENHCERLIVAGDAALLERAIVNLMQNAVLHNRRGGAVRILAGSTDGTSKLTIENDGAKLDPDEVEELVRPFRRVDRTVPGFGIGLSIANSIVVAHSGHLVLSAREQGGLTVDLVLPTEIEAHLAPMPTPA